jgi:hypothetical protein
LHIFWHFDVIIEHKASGTTFLLHKAFKDNACIMEFKVMKTYLLEQGPMPLFCPYIREIKIPLACLNLPEANGMLCLLWECLKLSNQFNLQVMKNESWVMVMEVFESQTIAYRSLFIVYGLWFDEKKTTRTWRILWFRKFGFQASLMEFFESFLYLFVLSSWGAFIEV